MDIQNNFLVKEIPIPKTKANFDMKRISHLIPIDDHTVIIGDFISDLIWLDLSNFSEIVLPKPSPSNIFNQNITIDNNSVCFHRT